MFVLSIVLFWLPLLGPLVAGFAGGRVAGNARSAMLAVSLPGLVLAGLILFFSTALLGMPLLGVFAGLGAFTLVMAHIAPMAAGALLGGATA